MSCHNKSQTSYLIYLDDSLVAWSSCKQNMVACSSTESERRVIATTITDLEWVKKIYQLSWELKKLPWCSIQIIQEPFFSPLIKFVIANSNKLLYGSEIYQRMGGDWVYSYITHSQQWQQASTCEIANVFTKVLNSRMFIDQRSNLVRTLSQD